MKVTSAGIKSRSADAIAVTGLLTTGVVIGWPVLAGGYLTYLDNPVHLAEMYAAGFEARSGWSEIAFCGFPISTLHSPLWYGVLSWLVKHGVSAGPLYAFCLWLGFVAPSVAVYGVVRRSLSPIPALALAYLLLVQRPAVLGIGSAFGGMWTFYLATAALIVLIDRLSRPCETLRDFAIVAALVGSILITHLYAVVPLGFMGVVHFLVVRSRKAENSSDRARTLSFQIAAGVLGILSAAVYWMPMLLARDAIVVRPQDLDASMVLARLVVPTHVFDLLNRDLPAFGPTVLVESLPMVALVFAGVVGVFFLGRRDGDAPLYGACTAAVLLTVLLFVTGEFDVKLLGPGSWRMLFFVRVGLVFSAIPFVVWIVGKCRLSGGRPQIAVVVVAAAAVALGWWFGRPLRAVTADSHGPEMAKVESLWAWLDTNKTDEWGRVYLQDTFELPNEDSKLSQSHVLALTAHRANVRQLGAGYGVAPYRAASWTPSEFKTLFRRWIRDQERVREIMKWVWAANVTHVVTCDPRTAIHLQKSEYYEEIYQTGRFVVFRSLPIECEWASALHPSCSVSVDEFETGRYRLRVHADVPEMKVLVKSSFHPNWRLSGPPGIRIAHEPSGLMLLEGFRAGESHVELEYKQKVWPSVLSALCWLVILSLLPLARARVNSR